MDSLLAFIACLWVAALLLAALVFAGAARRFVTDTDDVLMDASLFDASPGFDTRHDGFDTLRGAPGLQHGSSDLLSSELDTRRGDPDTLSGGPLVPRDADARLLPRGAYAQPRFAAERRLGNNAAWTGVDRRRNSRPEFLATAIEGRLSPPELRREKPA